MTEEVLLQVSNLSKHFESGNSSVTPLKNIHFEASSESFVAIVGPSGTGKSTLLHLLAGLDTPDSGEIVLAGKELQDLSPEEMAEIRLTDIGIVFQFFNLLPTLTLEQNLRVPAQLLRLPKKEQLERSNSLLSEMGIAELAGRYPHEVSGGEIQRASIARALMNQPLCLLADEPTGNLDPDTAAQVIELFQRIKKEHRVLLLVVTHDDRVAAAADRVLHLADGELKE